MAKEKKIVQKQVTKRYQLEKYNGKRSRHVCPNCGKSHVFARFVDVTTGEYLADDIGRCNRQTACGYIKSPKDANNKDLFVPLSTVRPQYLEKEYTHLINSKYVLKSLEKGTNNFIDFLFENFDPKQVQRVINLYKIGTGTRWENSTIFWQIDQNYDVRTGKIMLYDKETLKRVKEPYNHVSWIHTPKKDHNYGVNVDYSLTQCFFGEHLLNNEKFTKFAVVESEKTAILGNFIQPKIGWIATGGLMNINEERLFPFKDKELIFYPDKGKAYKEWEKKLKPFQETFNIKLSDKVETLEELSEGDDLGDYIISKFAKSKE